MTRGLIFCVLTLIWISGAQAQIVTLQTLKTQIEQQNAQVLSQFNQLNAKITAIAPPISSVTAPPTNLTGLPKIMQDCGLTSFTIQLPEQIATKVQTCINDVNSTVLADAQLGLAAAVANNNVLGQQCLKPLVAIITAATPQPITPATTPPTMTTPGFFAIFEAASEFVQAGGPNSCQTYIKNTTNGLLSASPLPTIPGLP